MSKVIHYDEVVLHADDVIIAGVYFLDIEGSDPDCHGDVRLLFLSPDGVVLLHRFKRAL